MPNSRVLARTKCRMMHKFGWILCTLRRLTYDIVWHFAYRSVHRLFFLTFFTFLSGCFLFINRTKSQKIWKATLLVNKYLSEAGVVENHFILKIKIIVNIIFSIILTVSELYTFSNQLKLPDNIKCCCFTIHVQHIIIRMQDIHVWATLVYLWYMLFMTTPVA